MIRLGCDLITAAAYQQQRCRCLPDRCARRRVETRRRGHLLGARMRARSAYTTRAPADPSLLQPTPEPPDQASRYARLSRFSHELSIAPVTTGRPARARRAPVCLDHALPKTLEMRHCHASPSRKLASGTHSGRSHRPGLLWSRWRPVAGRSDSVGQRSRTTATATRDATRLASPAA